MKITKKIILHIVVAFGSPSANFLGSGHLITTFCLNVADEVIRSLWENNAKSSGSENDRSKITNNDVSYLGH